MTKEMLLKKLKAYAKYLDTESAHYEADQALLQYINDPEIVEAYRAVEKWYS